MIELKCNIWTITKQHITIFLKVCLSPNTNQLAQSTSVKKTGLFWQWSSIKHSIFAKQHCTSFVTPIRSTFWPLLVYQLIHSYRIIISPLCAETTTTVCHQMITTKILYYTQCYYGHTHRPTLVEKTNANSKLQILTTTKLKKLQTKLFHKKSNCCSNCTN